MLINFFLILTLMKATTPPELNVVQSPQLFPSVKPVYVGSRWSSQAPETFLPNPNGKLKCTIKNQWDFFNFQ